MAIETKWYAKPTPKSQEKTAKVMADRNGFDLEGATKEGYTPAEVAEHLKLKEATQDKHLELMMCVPKYLSNKIANNKWIKDMSKEDREINVDKAMAQFFDLYGILAQDAMVYLLPPKKGLQDQVYISNAAMVLPHIAKTIVLANFTAPGRPGEEKELSKFLELTDFKQHPCPYKFEGEAEMKWLRDDIYFCGWGMRSDIKAFEWMRDKFGCKIIPVRERDELRYHLDCTMFPIDKETVLVAKDSLIPEEIKAIEKVADIIPISKKDAQFSLTNCVRVGSVVYNATGISELSRNDKDYEAEKHKNDALEKICRNKGLSLVWVNLSEFQKSGAALSCEILHLSRIAYPSST